MSIIEIRRLINLLEANIISPMNQSKDEISSILKEYFAVRTFSIDRNGLVNVRGSCFPIGHPQWEKLPIKFGAIGGQFSCHSLGLTTLEGCPQTVGASFDCGENRITSLQFCPKTVDGTFSCGGNDLTSLDHLTPNIGGTIRLSWHKDLPLLRLLQYNNNITFTTIVDSDLTHILYKFKGKGVTRTAILQCQKELINAGYAGNASW